MFLQLLQHLLNGLYVLFAFVFSIDEDIIEVYYHKNVELLCQDLIDIVLKRGRYVDQSKRHYLILKLAIVDSENCFPFIAFSDSHLIVSISQVELGEMLSPA